ncbi:DUF5134 domain-containing protein [Kitasatospora sp. NPDC059327]|uniref:DUF5134 domain-containing protein n=1 Tax=Kitasatospora sp. NPDC059327 TaxID=3346803 RepID=UPI00369D535A
MHGPVLVSWLLAALTATSGAYCLSRLGRGPCAADAGAGRLHAYESDAAEALMGLGMAAMAVTGAAVPAALWAWLFGLPALVFLLAAAHGRTGRAHRLHHAIGGLAMTYMALVMAAAPAHGHHHGASAGAPLLTGALLLYFGGYTLWAGTHLLAAPGGQVTVSPRTAGLPRACRLAMGVGMFAMLLTM